MSDSASEAAPDPRDVRPVVPLRQSGDWGLWIFLAVLLVGGIGLFSALSANRETAQAPATFAPRAGDNARIASPPLLGVPERFLEPAFEPETGAENGAENGAGPGRSPGAVPRPYYPPISLAQPSLPSYVPLPFQPRTDPQPRVVFEAGDRPAQLQTPSAEASGSERATAARFANPSRTVPLGTVIPAVLETALDSTRPGAVRALVQRDVFGFDGSRVLIQRGTRLYGEYEADLQSGQNRAMITWTRLLRPDGVTMNLNSPASDPLGRAGVKGKVDTKFLERFGGAILQSVLDIGVGVATRKATDGVIVALPGSTQNVQIQEPGQVRPTLKVRHGTSVSVFVARDLDFSAVDN